MLIYTAAQKRGANTFSDEMAVYVLLALGDVVDCFLVLGVDLELQFLNHISLFAKLLNSLAFCYLNDHDLFYVIRVSIRVKSKKKRQTAAAFLRSLTYMKVQI